MANEGGIEHGRLAGERRHPWLVSGDVGDVAAKAGVSRLAWRNAWRRCSPKTMCLRIAGGMEGEWRQRGNGVAAAISQAYR